MATEIVSTVFDNADSQITVTESASITNLPRVAYTAGAWIKAVNTEATMYMFYKNAANPDNWLVFIDVATGGAEWPNANCLSQQTIAGAGSANTRTQTADDTVDFDVWSWVSWGFTYSGIVRRYMINGSIIANDVATGSGWTPASIFDDSGVDLLIGNNGSDTRKFAGAMKNAVIANTNWSESESREQMYNADSVLSSNVMFLPMGGTGNQPDFSGSGNTGAATNLTAASDGPPIHWFPGGI